jgi:hypothetical protein
MAKQEISISKNAKRGYTKPKKTRQGRSCNTKYATHKHSKLYKKKYRGQGRRR